MSEQNVTTHSVTQNDGMLPMLDIVKPKHGIQVDVKSDNKTLWVTVDGQCVLRISKIPYIELYK